MLSLNIETSRNLTSVSIALDSNLECILNVDSERPNHCELLAPLIDKLFENTSFVLRDIEEVRVNVGPGNLSSLRVGISTANALSSFGNIPAYGISSFLLYAFGLNYNFDSLLTLFDLKNGLFAFAKFKRIKEKILLVDQNFKVSIDELRLVNVENTLLVGTAAGKIDPTCFIKSYGLTVDPDFVIDSGSLSRVDLNFNSEHILLSKPLMPFNSFSFVS